MRMKLLLQAHVLSVLLVAKGPHLTIIPLISYCVFFYSVALKFYTEHHFFDDLYLLYILLPPFQNIRCFSFF
jgi:hypothetical protein